MRSLFFALLLIAGLASASSAHAQVSWRKGAPGWARAEDIAAEKHLRHICMSVDGRTRSEAADGAYGYKAIQGIVNAAGVSGRVDTPEKREKVQAVWKRFEDYLVCNSLQFDVVNGSVLKYAVHTLFDDFVYFAAETRIGFTRVDDDGRTLLDYVKDKRDRAPGSETAKKMQHYYDLLRKAGARHRHELP